MSSLYTEASKMCDVICDEPSLLQMMSRFGIPLGVGEQSVKEVCERNKVDTTTFLAVANFIKHGSDVVDQYLDRLSVPSLITYLGQAHNYFLDFQLPNIRRKLLEAIDCSQQNEVAYLILKFYDEYMGEVRRHMQHENSKIFTYVNELLEGRRRGDFEISQFARSHSSIDKKLQELKNIIIKYYTPTDSTDLLNNVLFDIFNCEADLRMHCGVEDELFVPVVQLLEAKVSVGDVEPVETDDKPKAQEVLSDREREIVGCIVRGMTNKEVAEKLFISVNTVLTHRKNIARKLNIHSVSGLTIYAIAGGLVNINEISY